MSNDADKARIAQHAIANCLCVLTGLLRELKLIDPAIIDRAADEMLATFDQMVDLPDDLKQEYRRQVNDILRRGAKPVPSLQLIVGGKNENDQQS